MSVLFGLKLVLVPALIGAITLAGRRWGPVVAGWLSAFPVVSGPILYFIAVEQGPAFAATSAAGTLSAVLAILAFGTSYAWAATRFSWSVSLAAGFCCYFVAVIALSFWPPTLFISAALVLVAPATAPLLFPKSAPNHTSTSSRIDDIHLRMIAGGALVILVMQYSSQLGPRLSGLFAMFPVMGSVLAAFSHRSMGAEFTVRLLRGMVFGYYAFAVFCFSLALALPHFGVDFAFLLSLVLATLVQVASRKFLKRAQQEHLGTVTAVPRSTLLPDSRSANSLGTIKGAEHHR